MSRMQKLLWWLLIGGLLFYGAWEGGSRFVWSRAATLCLSCMGLQ